MDRRELYPEKENRPTWAMTPNLAVALNAQRSQRAEDVFGKVQPIKLEGKIHLSLITLTLTFIYRIQMYKYTNTYIYVDFFKGSGKKFPNRSSTSNWSNNI